MNPKPDKLLKHHLEGLYRVVKFIEGFAHPEQIWPTVAQDAKLEYMNESVSISVKRQRALKENCSRLYPQDIRVTLPTSIAPASFGSTANNLREFSFFDSLLEMTAAGIAGNNLYFYSYEEPAEIHPLASEYIARLMDDIDAFYASRETIDAILVFHQLLYTRRFLNYLFSFIRPQAKWPALLVLSNDHSPANVAISMLMKAAGVPRVYMQHAEVVNSMPELDFEFNVLRNQKSLETYRSMGEVPGEVYIFSRETAPFAAQTLARQIGDKTDVVIYANVALRIDKLKQALRLLQANSGIGKISLKPHPRSTLDFATLLPDLHIVETVPQHSHIAIVGNSAVVVELLHQGIPVYQNFELDDSNPDFYGFVRGGIVQAVSLSALSEKFWKPYVLDEAWLNRYGKLNPAALPDHDRLDVQRFRQAMHPYFASVP